MGELFNSRPGVPFPILRDRLAKRLRDNLGLAEPIAIWAIESWAVALGLLSPDQVARLEFKCPRCQASGRIPSAFVGKLVRCPKCKARVRIDPDGTSIALETDTPTIPPQAASVPPPPPIQSPHSTPLTRRFSFAVVAATVALAGILGMAAFVSVALRPKQPAPAAVPPKANNSSKDLLSSQIPPNSPEASSLTSGKGPSYFGALVRSMEASVVKAFGIEGEQLRIDLRCLP